MLLQSLLRPVLTPIMRGIFDPAQSVSAAWSPADLTSLVAWYDPSDLSTMFQDAAGTTPVTAAGQPVGLILDKSGNGHHASQATSTARPLFQIDGSGKHYLAFDGVDDYLSTSAINLTGTDKVTVFSGLRVLANAYHGLVHFGTDLSVDTGGFLIWTRPDKLVEAYTPKQAGYVSSNEALSAPRTFVNTTAYDLAASTVATEIALRIDGASAPSTAVGPSASGNFGNLSFKFGSYSSFFLNGNLYSLIIGGALYDAATVSEAEAWVAEKTGVTP